MDCRDEASDEGLARAERCNKGYSATARTMLTLRESDGKGRHSVDTLDRRERVWVKRDLLIRQGGNERLAAAVFHPLIGVAGGQDKRGKDGLQGDQRVRGDGSFSGDRCNLIDTRTVDGA